VAAITVRSHMAGDAPELCDEFSTKSYTWPLTTTATLCIFQDGGDNLCPAAS